MFVTKRIWFYPGRDDPWTGSGSLICCLQEHQIPVVPMRTGPELEYDFSSGPVVLVLSRPLICDTLCTLFSTLTALHLRHKLSCFSLQGF